MNTLIFDTETTGRADMSKPFDHDCQPRLVQLGALLLDPNWEPRAELNLIIRPYDFDIPIAAAKAHGISTDIASDLGVPETITLELFSDLVNRVETVVSHNFDFDFLVMYKAFRMNQMHLPNRLGQIGFCTMRAMTDHCKLPGRFDKYKWPSLTEAHQYCFGCDFPHAHDAMADVRACAAIYKWLKTGGKPYAPEPIPNPT